MGKLRQDLIKKIPISEATTPFNGAEVMTNRYWSVEDDCILFYGHSAQCNSDQKLSEYVSKKIWPNAEVRFLPVVYVKRRD